MGNIADKESVIIALNAKDKDKGNPPFQLTTPDPDEDSNEVYIRTNPAISRPHTIAKHGGGHYSQKGEGKEHFFSVPPRQQAKGAGQQEGGKRPKDNGTTRPNEDNGRTKKDTW